MVVTYHLHLSPSFKGRTSVSKTESRCSSHLGGAMIFWQIGYVYDCNFCHTGSIPAEISIFSIEVILCLIYKKGTIEP